MTKGKNRRIFAFTLSVSLLVSTLFCGGVAPEKAYGATLNDLKGRQQQLKQELDKTKKNLKSLAQDISEEAKYQEEINYQITLNKEQIDNLEEQISLLLEDIDLQNEQIAIKEDAVDEKKAEIDDTYEAFKIRIRSMYMAGEASALEMLFSSKNFSDFFTTVKLMQAVSDHDEKLVKDLKQKKASLEYEIVQLEEIVAQVKADVADVEEQKAALVVAQEELQDAYSKSKSAMQDMDAMKAEYEKNLDKIKAEEDAVEAELQEWYRKQAAASGGKLTDSVFIWPLPSCSYISSGFGMRWGAMHRGIDITGGGCFGKDIVAANSGKVIQAVSMHWSYGNYLVIDHGGGYTTLYAHCSQLLVGVGDVVGKGQTIAKVGSTGNSSGPHLHFEVRINGTANNPTNFVAY